MWRDNYYDREHFLIQTTVKPRQRSRQRILSINCHSLKELREAQRWLRLIKKVPLLKNPKLLDELLLETEELIKIFVTSIKTAGKKK